MAIMHRKLFPAPDSDQTTDCSDCGPACPYDCAYGELYWPPQPPPLPPSSIINDDNTTTHISPYLILTVSLIGCAVLLISYYLIMVRYCTRFRRPPATQVNEESQDFFNEDQGPEIDHPIWYITTVGFQPAVINSITVVKFKKGDGLIDGTDCSVCLTEFHDDESLRLLPKCNHAFHIPCIDTWLRSHTNCPLCRAAIFPTISNTISRPVHQNRNHGFGMNQNTQIENADDGDELGANRAGEAELSENSRERGAEVDFRQIEDETKEAHDPKPETESVTALTRSTSIDSAAAIFLHQSNSSNSAMDLQSSNHMRDSRARRMMIMRSFSYGGRSIM